MSATHKAQLRSLKDVVNSKLNSTLRPRHQMQYAEHGVIAPSAPQSECSTLVDFGIDYTLEDPEYSEAEHEDNTLLGADNCAWARQIGKQSQQSLTSRNVSCSTPKRHHSAQMMDIDDRAWDSSRQKESLPTRILHALAGQ